MGAAECCGTVLKVTPQGPGTSAEPQTRAARGCIVNAKSSLFSRNAKPKSSSLSSGDDDAEGRIICFASQLTSANALNATG